MRTTVIPIVNGTHRTALGRELEELEIRGWIETTQTTVLLRLARMLRRVLKTWGDLWSLRLRRKIINWRWCEKLAKGIIIIIIIIIIIHDWVGKVIHWEMCKKLKFNHTNQWYMHNPALVQENDTHKLLWDFGIHTDHLISTRRPDLIIINKKKKEKENMQNCRLCCPGWPQNWKNVKRRLGTSTLLGNWKNYGTWRWQLYQL